VDYVRVYLPQSENANRHNKDVSATYFIGATNCYDSLATGVPVLWNSNYADEMVYPNPFNQETTLSFTLHHPAQLHLTILNNQGQRVRNLLTGNVVQEGTFLITWDGKDGNGNKLPNGVYWYLLQDETGSTQNGKMILMR
jgi:flagellar hook assembly protein FlgD